jgi:hypothetical protein
MPERLVTDKAISGNHPALTLLEIAILIDREAVSVFSLNPLPPSPTILLPSFHYGPTPRPLAIFLPFPMTQPTSSSFQALFSAALQDYENQTRTRLLCHPFAKQLETCESVSSITAVLQEQAQSFREFRENDGKLMKALNSSIDVLCAPSISSALGETIGLGVRRKAFIGLPYTS